MTMLVVGVLFAPFGGRLAAITQDESDQRLVAAFAVFEDRIDEYATLRQRLEARLLFVPSEDPCTFVANRAQLAAAIKAARPAAFQGELFTPAAGTAIRQLIADALTGRDVEALLRDLFAEHAIVEPFHPRIYEPYPEWGTHEMPIVLLQHLPPLPEGVEYRLIGHDLVLWDIDADLIIDVLPDAVPHITT
jgi:hypothetical protein